MNRALLVGINKYPGSPLQGCVNDISDMAKFLVTKCGFRMDEIRLLTDERATRIAILDRLGWLLRDIRRGDRILFHYSGHGVQLPTRDIHGEVDGLDEAICPVDFDWTDLHTIRDKEFNTIFLKVPEGVEFIWISDSCHSGDLWREIPKCEHRQKTIFPPVDINWRLHTAKEKNIHAMTMLRAVQNTHIALIAGCKSNQTSADTIFGKRPNGAFTYFLLNELNSKRGMKESLSSVIKHVQKALQDEGYKQIPQLEGNILIKASPFLTI